MDEACLVRRCLDGDDAAFATLVERHKLMVYNIVDRMVGADAADDLAQEAFVRVHQGLAGFRGDAKLSTWIYRITYRLCLEALQRRARSGVTVPLSEEHAEETEAGPVAAPLPVTDAGFAQAEARQAVEHGLAQLPAHYRMALTLFYLQERRYDEIAEVMELPMGTVKTYLHRAKAQLREHLIELEAEP